MVNLLQKDRKEKKPTAHSGTFGCLNARATASQPKEPSFCLHTERPLIIQTFFILKNEILKINYYFCGLIILRK